MKKKVAVLLSLVLALSITACGGEKDTVASGNENLPSQQVESQENVVEESTQTEEAEGAENIVEETMKPVVESAPEETPESVVESAPEKTSEPVTEATPEPTSEPTAEPTPEPTPEPTSEPTPEPAAGMRPEFKEAMDSYEAFYDEYCAFMKKYQENPADLSLLAEYANMMGKLTEMDEKFDAWENGDLNDEELKYYMEVQTRVSQKMLEVL